MTAKELALKQVEELQALRAEWCVELREVGFKVATRQASAVRRLRELRKDLARLETVLKQKSPTK